MAQIYTSHKLNAGQTFGFYSLDQSLLLFDEVEIWSERSVSDNPLIYGRARVVRVPDKKYNLYMGLVLSGENCN
jgi:hypothetical protein